MMFCTCDILWGEVTGDDCTSGWWRMDLVMPGVGGIARVGYLMVLEAGELGTWGDGMVLEYVELPTLTSFVALLVLEWLEVNASSSLLGTVVFLLPWQLSGGLLLVWDPSVLLIGSWKVTSLAVFLLPPGVWTTNWSEECVATRLGTWNWIIPNLSDVA